MALKRSPESELGGWHLKSVSTNGTINETVVGDNVTREFVGSVPLVSFIYLIMSCIIIVLLFLHAVRWLKAFSRRSQIRSPLSMPPRYLPSREFEERLDRFYQSDTLPPQQAAQSSQSIPDSAFGPKRGPILIRSLSSLSQKKFSRKEKQGTDIEMQENPAAPTPGLRQSANPLRPATIPQQPDLISVQPSPYTYPAPHYPPLVLQPAPQPQQAPQRGSPARNHSWGPNNPFAPYAIPHDPGFGPVPVPVAGYYPDETPTPVPVPVSAPKNGNEHSTGFGRKDGYQLFKRRAALKPDAEVTSSDIHECRDLVRARYAIGHTIRSIQAGQTTAGEVGLRLPNLRNRAEFVLYEVRRILGEWSAIRSQWNEVEWGLLEKIQRKLVVLEI
jgi:hypothetical protein